MLTKTPNHILKDTQVPTPKAKLEAHIAAIKMIRDTDEYMTPQMFHILLEVAHNPAITMQQLMKNTDLALSSISRNLAALSEWHRVGKEGLNFVETIDDPEERRRKLAFLTPKGRSFIERWFQLTNPDQPIRLDCPTAREWLNQTHRTRRTGN